MRDSDTKSVVDFSTLARVYDADADLDELRAEALRLTAQSVFVAAVLLDVAVAVSPALPREMWLVAAALAATALLVSRAVAASVQLAVAGLVVGLSLAVAGATLLMPGVPLACLFSLVVLLAGALLGWPAGVASAAGATGLVGMMAREPDSVVSVEAAVVALLMAWGSVFAAWLVSRPLRTALGWSWHSYAQALRIAEEARERQGELARLSKSLNETCDRLSELTQELDRARRAAEEALRLKAEFAAAVSHELRTPLNLIIGFSEMMALSPATSYGEPLPASYARDVEAIYRNASHISKLIDDILDLSQIEARRMGLQRARASLAEIAEEAAAIVAPRFRARGLALTIDVPAGLPAVPVDPTRIRQVLINLLGNALRFTDVGGVTVTATCAGQELVVTVADTGVGIAAEDLPHVFEEFRQTGSAERRRGGSGLGLAVSKRFVEMHGGSMWVESELGRGSAFHFQDDQVRRSDLGTVQAYDQQGVERSPRTAGVRPGPALGGQQPSLGGPEPAARLDEGRHRGAEVHRPVPEVHHLVRVASGGGEGAGRPLVEQGDGSAARPAAQGGLGATGEKEPGQPQERAEALRSSAWLRRPNLPLVARQLGAGSPGAESSSTPRAGCLSHPGSSGSSSSPPALCSPPSASR